MRPALLALCAALPLLLAGCGEPRLTVTHYRFEADHEYGSATYRCTSGKALHVVDVSILNDSGYILSVAPEWWRVYWSGSGAAAEPLFVDGPREVRPDGVVEVSLGGCPPKGTEAHMQHVVLLNGTTLADVYEEIDVPAPSSTT